MAWEKATVAVYCCTNGKKKIGTGFAVAPGKILTAKHVVTPGTDDADVTIEVRWWHSQATGFKVDDATRFDGYIPAKIIWSAGENATDLDVVLLEAEHPPDLLTNGLTPLGNSNPKHGVCTTEGFPVGAMINKRVTAIRVDGTSHTLWGNGKGFQVDLEHDPNQLNSWGGLSGAPVIDPSTGTAIGIFVTALHQLDNNKFVHALPITRIWEAPGFRQALHGDGWQSAPLPQEYRSSYEKRVHAQLAERIGRLSRSVRDQLCRNFELLNVQELSSNFSAVAELIAKGVGDAVSKTREVQKTCVQDSDDFSELGKIAALFALLNFDDLTLQFIRHCAQEHKACGSVTESSPASTPVYLELIAAAIDEGMPEFALRNTEDELPHGKTFLPFLGPEAGPNSNMMNDYVADLCNRMGIGSVAAGTVLSNVEAHLAKQEYRLLQTVALVEGQELDERVMKRLSNALARRRLDGERSFYLPFALPQDPDERRKFRDAILRLRARYPDILALALDPDLDKADAEEVRLARVISTVPLKGLSHDQA